jgi:superoxide reductase
MPFKTNELYECTGCPLIVEVLNPCDCTDSQLTCGSDPVALMPAKGAAQEGKEKHVPVIEKTGDGIKVKVGSVEHPMEDDHYIQWITLVCKTCDMTMRKRLKPGEKPEAFFPCPQAETCDVYAQEHCNKHGLWIAQ